MDNQFVLVRLHPAAAPAVFLTTSYIGRWVKTDSSDEILLTEVGSIYEQLLQDPKTGQLNISDIIYVSSAMMSGEIKIKAKDVLWSRPVEDSDPILKGYNNGYNQWKTEQSGIVRPTMRPPQGRR